MFDEYRFSGSLPENASTYVTREADGELYELLKAGKFCYVLNSRQTGKSSIRVRTMGRLRDAGVECAAIDLSAGGVQDVTPEQWYVDLIDNLIESFDLDVDLEEWWENNQLHSTATRFRKFVEEVLLVEIKENIVIFIDEIDSVLSLKFPTDDFFALIRAFHNQRVDNPEYNRLTFCLLGVASPSNLIKDKQRTPFNIGTAIYLKGFQLHEVEPLRKGLEGKFLDTQKVMKEILDWTGGQPFLTQKLCQYVMEESEKEHPASVEEVVRARIIENWELQDVPEHLRTIRSRFFRDEERAAYLLDLYQQVRDAGEVASNEALEQSELLLSGLVGKQHNQLKVYNRIYYEVYNQNWIEAELKKLRPYSEAFRAWVTSGGKDESRLLRGNALVDAESWGKDKNLSHQDREFLAASRKKEIQEEITAKEKAAQLERERKDREAVEERNKTLAEANIKAKRRIQNGTVVLFLTVLGAGIVGLLASKNVVDANNQVAQAKKDVEIKQEEFTNAQQEIQKLEENKEDIIGRVEESEQREKNAIQNKKAVENELNNKKQSLAQADRELKKSEQEARKLKNKVEESNQRIEDRNKEIEDRNKELISVQNSKQELETQIKKIRQDKERSQKKLNQAQRKLYDTQQKNHDLQQQVTNTEEFLQTVETLAKLAGELENEGSDSEAKELLSQAGQSVKIKDHKLKQAVLYAGISYAHQKLKSKDLKSAQNYLDKSQEQWKSLQGNNSQEASQIRILTFKTQGNLFKEQEKPQQAIEEYKKAFEVLNKIKEKGKRGKVVVEMSPVFNPNIQIKILSKQNIEALHREFIALLSKNGDTNLKKQIEESLTEHYLNELNNLLANQKWQEADIRTTRLMLYVANREERDFLDVESLQKFSCKRLKDIDLVWLQNSKNQFGFRVQKRLWVESGLRLGVSEWTPEDEKAYQDRFTPRVGWYDSQAQKYLNYTEVMSKVKEESDKGIYSTGILPTQAFQLVDRSHSRGAFFSRTATCKL